MVRASSRASGASGIVDFGALVVLTDFFAGALRRVAGRFDFSVGRAAFLPVLFFADADAARFGAALAAGFFEVFLPAAGDGFFLSAGFFFAGVF